MQAQPAPRLSEAPVRHRGHRRELPIDVRKPIFPVSLSMPLRRRSMDIQALGYVGVHARSLEDWTGFGTRFLGMQLVEKSGAKLALRMDDRKQRVVVEEDGGEGVAFFGWEV